MRERPRKLQPSANEQRPISLALVVEERGIVADSFRRQRFKRDHLCFGWIRKLMLIAVGQED